MIDRAAFWTVAPSVAPLAMAFVLPLVAVFQPRRLRVVVAVGGGAVALLTLGGAWQGLTGGAIAVLGGWPRGIGVPLVIDPLAAVYLAVHGVGAALVLIALMGGALPVPQEGSSGQGRPPWRFFVAFFLLWAGLNGLVTSGDLFNLYVFLEILSIAAYVLVGAPRTPAASGAGLRYLVFGSLGGLFLLIAIGALYVTAGTLDLTRLAPALERQTDPALAIIRGAFLIGVFIKAGVAPGHFWLPAAHAAASAPTSALLSGILLETYLYLLLRLGTIVFYGQDLFFRLLVGTGVLSIVVGHLGSLYQTDIKRLLAFSSVAHVGYLVVGIGCRHPVAAAGVLLHVIAHAAAKMGLFLAAGELAAAEGTRRFADWRDAARSAPLAASALTTLAAAGLGLPPFGLFWSKWLLISGAIAAGQIAAGAVVAVGSVLAAAPWLSLVEALFRQPPPNALPANHGQPVRATPAGLVASGLAGLSLALGLGLLTPAAWNFVLWLGAAALDRTAYLALVHGATTGG